MPSITPEAKLEPLLDAVIARKMSYQRVYSLILRGDLEAVKRGGRWWVDPQLLEALRERPL